MTTCVRCEQEIRGQVWVQRSTGWHLCTTCAPTDLIDSGEIVRQEEAR